MTEQERLEQERQEWLILLEEDDWASAVRRRLAELERTQEDLARYIDVPLGRINRHLRGVGRPDDREMKAVTRALAYWAKARYRSWSRLTEGVRPFLHFPPVLRRLTLAGAALTVALSLMTQTASAGAADYGPGGTADASTTPTTYTMPIPVIDAMAPTLNPERRKIWRQARNAALANWTTGCVSFAVTTSTTTGAWDDSIGSTGFSPLLTSGSITIFRNQSSSTQMLGWWDAASGGGFAVYAPWAPWWKDYYRTQMVGDIGHELGHALGFGHGGNGIMMGSTDRPTQEELDLLRAYYC
jgi:hypothetical protein